MKKLFLVFLLVFLFTFSAKGEETRSHFLYAGINIFVIFFTGLSIGYEYSINNNFSISIDAGTVFGAFPYATTTVRWYPWANIFFVGLGPGAWLYPSLRFFISPTIGWKILLGRQGRLFLMPNLAGKVEMPPFNNFFHIFPRANLSVGFSW